MSSFVNWIVGVIIGMPQRLHAKKEHGAITIEQVIWTALIAIAAVAAIAVIVGIINGYVARIPTAAP